MFKRIFALTLSALFIVMAMAGCGNSGSDAKPDSGAAPQSAAQGGADVQTGTGEKEFKAVELQWWNIGSEQPDIDRINKLASEYLASIGKPYTIKLTLPGWGDYSTRTENALTTGEKVDLVFTCNWTANYQEFGELGYFTDLTPYLEEYPDIVDIIGADFLYASKVGDATYALPTNKEKARVIGYLLNKTIVDKYEIDVSAIKDLEDLEEIFAMVKENEPGVWPVQPEKVPMDMFWVGVAGGWSFTGEAGDLKLRFKEFDDISINAYNKVTEWYQNGWVNPDLVGDSYNTNAEMASGRYFAWGAQLKPGKDAEMSDANQQWVQVELGEIQIANDEIDGAMHGIPSTSDNQDEAFDFLHLLYTDPYLINLFNFGEEGVDYVFAEDDEYGRIEILESGYNFNSGWTFGNQFLNLLTIFEEPDKWEKMEAFNEEARPLDSLGFFAELDESGLRAQVSALDAVLNDKYTDLKEGRSKDVAGDLEKMRKDIEAIGYEDLGEALQAQFDEWYAENN